MHCGLPDQLLQCRGHPWFPIEYSHHLTFSCLSERKENIFFLFPLLLVTQLRLQSIKSFTASSLGYTWT